MEKRVDVIGVPFDDDPEILGEWTFVDFLQNAENFSPGIRSMMDEPYLHKISFLNDGAVEIDIGSGSFVPSLCNWSKGSLIDKFEQTNSAYFIKDFEGETYLFFEWKSGDYSYRSMDPWYYVFKKEIAR